jgi:hypothetical protein
MELNIVVIKRNTFGRAISLVVTSYKLTNRLKKFMKHELLNILPYIASVFIREVSGNEIVLSSVIVGLSIGYMIPFCLFRRDISLIEPVLIVLV